MEKCMEMENINIIMELFIKENIVMGLKMDMEN